MPLDFSIHHSSFIVPPFECPPGNCKRRSKDGPTENPQWPEEARGRSRLPTAARRRPDREPLDKLRPPRAFPGGKEFCFAYLAPTQSRPSVPAGERRRHRANPPFSGDVETTGQSLEAGWPATRLLCPAENRR